MQQLDNPRVPRTRRFWRRVAIPPVCLVLVAGLHLVRVATCHQTPWKGGGFGMFSTVDSESARFLRVFAVTPDGDLPLEIPERWENRAWELRAAPTPEMAKLFATRLAEMPWQQPDPPLVGDMRLEAIAPGQSTARATAVWEVRVECWRLVYETSNTTLRTQKLFTADSHSFMLPIPAATSDL